MIGGRYSRGALAPDGEDYSDVAGTLTFAGGTMYRVFDPAILHYALTCGDPTTLHGGRGAYGDQPNPVRQRGRLSRSAQGRPISSATQAVFMRQYKLPAGHGYSYIRGAVRELENGRWLIAWGDSRDPTRPARRQIRVSEVDPASGAAVFELAIYRDTGSMLTYRAYGEREADLDLPLNLP